MSEDNHNLPENDDDSELSNSASALFLEMMRQAAQRDTGSMSPAADQSEMESDFKALQFHLAPEENDSPADRVFIPEEELFPDTEPGPNDVRPAVYEEDFPEEEFEPESEPVVEPEPDLSVIAGGRVPIYTAPSGQDSENERIAKLEAQRVRRLRRRQERRQRRRVGILGGFFRTAFAIIVAAALASTVFTWFTDPDFFTPGVISGLQVADATSVVALLPETPTALVVTPNWARRVGIVSGHRGPENDPGAVCDDGLTEGEINFAIAQLVVRTLREEGYSVDLLDEFDPRLQNYQAAALISIHSNDCQDYGEIVSGYLVARASARPGGGLDDVLAECIARDYGEATNLERRFSLTIDMTDYHTFREINAQTPAAIIELGFMRDDRELLTGQQSLLAQGIVEGIICFLSGENPVIAPTDIPPTETGVAPIDLEQPAQEG